MGQDPIVVATGQQIAPVQGNRSLQSLPSSSSIPSLHCSLRPVQRTLETGHVQAERGARPPLQGLGSGLQETVGIRQGAAQPEQQSAQVAERLGFRRVGPELEGGVGAGLGRIPVQQEVGQQRLQARGVDLRHRCFCVTERTIPQQVNVQYAGQLQPPCSLQAGEERRRREASI